MMSFEMNDRKKIGLGLTGFGVFFSFLGIIFFFDKGLLAMGNVLFISGVALTIGLKSSAQFFMKRSNFKGTVSFGAGFVLVVIGWAILGMILEAYGFVVLFSGFWPTLAVFLQKIPIIGWIFQQPLVRSVCSLIVTVEKEYLCKHSLEVAPALISVVKTFQITLSVEVDRQ
ncbi:vesicle transport protein GOT1-like isoform X1 [Henckelia pumila]|uniref:vesicle transport protein GOT1-like isoform X1 n=1 Tax=Henckelia pumila TaxID=405737 RepID=UPI003C6E0EDC